MRQWMTVFIILVIVALSSKEALAGKSGEPAISGLKLQALEYRNIGPSRGGRSTAVTGVTGQPYTFLMGTAGGVWKTTNAGGSWENISDRYFGSGSIGAIAVSESDPHVIYVGTGQSTLRGNVALGVGVYKSIDAGKTWKHIGLPKAGQIGRIRIHPKNFDLVYVAVIGNAFIPNEERGLFRSKNGGMTWEKVLSISPKTGFADLAMDPVNPRVLYASAWTGQRKPWTIVSGSDECALYKTVDGGDTWTKLGGGLPQGVVGKIGVAISPPNPDRVWALVEAEQGGLFRSDDAGKTWQRLDTNMKRRLLQRAWYYMHIFADPRDEQKVYILNVDQFRSRDGGKTFEQLDLPHGDGHDMWINPDNPRILIVGNDGGATVSLDDGNTWSTLLNQPTAEIYYVATDLGFPYRIYGAQQDNTTISLPSRALPGLSPYEHWRDVGGCEDGHIAFDPRNPDIVYAGCYGGEITRYNVKTGEIRNIMTYPEMEVGLAPRDLRYRFNWNAPIRVSPHDSNVIYHASQYIHRTTNDGHSWEIISPDLSRNDKSKQNYSGEPITYENTGIEVYCNVLSFEESPSKAGVLWAGSDDGLVHISKDNGKSWQNITPAGMPEWSTVNSIELSLHDPARAFFAVYKYKLGDLRPYIYRTNDYGKSWTLLTTGENGISDSTPTRVVREDPARKGLLYAGTESGMFVSFDDGRQWQSLQLNLPIVPVTDLRVHQNDLVLATQGRSFWILDDLTPIHQLAAGAASANNLFLFKPRDTYRMRITRGKDNPPNGAFIFYYLPEELKGEVLIEVSDETNRIIQTFSSEREPHPNPEFLYDFIGIYEGDKRVSKKKGLNRFVWNLRDRTVDFPSGTIVWGYLGGAKVPPGVYKITLRSGDWKQTQSFQVLKDLRVAATDQELQEQARFMIQIRDDLNRLYHGVRVIRSLREQARNTSDRLAAAGGSSAEVKNAAESLWKKLSGIEEELMQPKNEADQDTENFPTKLDNQLAYVYMALNDTDSRPTAGQRERVKDLEQQIELQLVKLKAIIDKDLVEFNKLAVSQGALPLVPPAPTKE